MDEASPDIFSILESFLRENLAAKYGEGLEEFLEYAANLIRNRVEQGAEGLEERPRPSPRKPAYEREPDLEQRLLESLKTSLDKHEASQ